MRLSHVLAASCVIAVAVGGGVARAQDTPEPATGGDPSSEEAKEGIEGGEFDDYNKAGLREKKIKPEYGIGLRLRGVFEPKAIIELFLEEAASGVFSPGFGLELNRRRGNFELVLGFEYENVSPDNGFYLEKGDDPVVAGEAPDYVKFDGLAWFTADLAFIFHSPINDKVSFRYGAGFGLGIVLGDALQTDSTCTSRDIQNDCTPLPEGPGVQYKDPADLPPVFPVVDLLAGFQFKPTPKMTINIEGGLRTLFFFGLSSTYYF
jgi:hypothetical protein